MSVHNKEIIDKLNELADMFDIKGENEFRVRAYRKAARSLSGFIRNISEMVINNEDISSLSGIGKSMSDKIEEIVHTGNLKQLKKLRKEIPESLVEIMKLEQLGPQRTKILNDTLNIRSMEELGKAAKAGKIEKIRGFGKKTTERILEEIESWSLKEGSARIKRTEAELLVNPMLRYMEDKVEKEVDILEDGSLDLPDTILKEFDLVVCSVHYYRKLTRKKQTQRIIRAMQNPYFNILAHPTGRMIGMRDELDTDMEAIMKEAKNNGCFLKISANPDRLVLNDDYARRAKKLGIRISIATDAHSVNSLQYMEYGIVQARRGWLEKEDVINTRSLSELKKLLKR